MKISRLFFLSLTAGLVFSANAHAASVAVTKEKGLGLVLANESNADVFDYSASSKTEGVFDYLLHGRLAANTEITFTLSATNVAQAGKIDLLSVSGGTNVPDSPAVTLNQLENGSLPLVSLANIGSAVDPEYSLVVKNATSSVEKFAAYFGSLIDLKKGGTVTVGYSTSPVPLPSAFLLFVSGLLGLGGFAAYRKAERRA